MTKIMLFLLSISHMGKAWVPVHTSNLYVSEVTYSYYYNEETIYDNDFTAEYQAGLCKTYIDDLIAEKGKKILHEKYWQSADETYYNSHREKMDDWKKKIDCYAGRQ